MTAADTKAPAYTYEPDAQESSAFSMAQGGKLITGWRARVRRSDGQIVWVGDQYDAARTAKLQAGRTAAKFRAYLAHHGACWYDRDTAAKAHAKAFEKARHDTARELMNIASAATKEAFAGRTENCPYATDSAQGIIWTHAYRLTLDRLTDWIEENPEPVQP